MEREVTFKIPSVCTVQRVKQFLDATSPIFGLVDKRIEHVKVVTSYVETIAGQWKRAGIKTAKEAMEFAEKEHKKLSKKEENNKEKVSTPIWFDKKIEDKELSSEDEKELKEFLEGFK